MCTDFMSYEFSDYYLQYIFVTWGLNLGSWPSPHQKYNAICNFLCISHCTIWCYILFNVGCPVNFVGYMPFYIWKKAFLWYFIFYWGPKQLSCAVLAKFPEYPNLQNAIPPKLLEILSWNFGFCFHFDLSICVHKTRTVE